jgi:APA family basic amino acid/polyamine antiporter
MVGVVFCEAQGCFFAFMGLMPFLLLRKKKIHKRMPIGILGSLVICTILYVLFAYVLTGLENYLNFKGDANPVTTICKNRLHILNSGLTIAIIAGYTSVMLVMLMGQSRVFIV